MEPRKSWLNPFRRLARVAYALLLEAGRCALADARLVTHANFVKVSSVDGRRLGHHAQARSPLNNQQITLDRRRSSVSTGYPFNVFQTSSRASFSAIACKNQVLRGSLTGPAMRVFSNRSNSSALGNFKGCWAAFPAAGAAFTGTFDLRSKSEGYPPEIQLILS